MTNWDFTDYIIMFVGMAVTYFANNYKFNTSMQVFKAVTDEKFKNNDSVIGEVKEQNKEILRKIDKIMENQADARQISKEVENIRKQVEHIETGFEQHSKEMKEFLQKNGR